MTLPERSVDVETLDAATAERLRNVVSAAMREGSSSAPEAVPDAMTYAITIDEGGRSITLKGTDANLSKDFAELIDLVEQLG